MTIDLNCTGRESKIFIQEYDWHDVALYAIGLGAGTDDLKYLLDNPKPEVIPTYGVIPTFKPVFELLKSTGGDMVTLLHSSQRTQLIKPFPSSGTMKTTAKIRGIWDMKIGATIIIDTESTVNGDLTCKTTWSLLLRGEGGFGGERPPARLRVKPPAGKEADFCVKISTSKDQALLYRLNGDINPIHSDPKVAKAAGFDKPILHGLCFYGIAGRVALKELANDDPSRFVSLEALFAKPVMPGDTLVAQGFKLEKSDSGLNRAAITLTVEENGNKAIANCLFEYI